VTHLLSRTFLASALIAVSAACANPTTPSNAAPAERPGIPWSVAVSAAGDANAQFVTVVSPFDWSATSSAIDVCGKRVGTRCTYTRVCTALTGTWAAASRHQVDGVYDYQITCGAVSSDEALSAVACDACEILYGPHVLKSYRAY
jgi:hypothetical protein